MSVDALAYSIQGRTGRFGQVDGLSQAMLGKITKITAFVIVVPPTFIIEIESEVLRVMNVDGLTHRDFLIIGRDDTGTSFLAKELISGVIKTMDLNTQVVRSTDIESIVEIDDPEEV